MNAMDAKIHSIEEALRNLDDFVARVRCRLHKANLV